MGETNTQTDCNFCPLCFIVEIGDVAPENGYFWIRDEVTGEIFFDF